MGGTARMDTPAHALIAVLIPARVHKINSPCLLQKLQANAAREGQVRSRAAVGHVTQGAETVCNVLLPSKDREGALPCVCASLQLDPLTAARQSPDDKQAADSTPQFNQPLLAALVAARHPRRSAQVATSPASSAALCSAAQQKHTRCNPAPPRAACICALDLPHILQRLEDQQPRPL